MVRDKKKDAAASRSLHALTEGAKPANMRVHIRGNPATLGEEAPRRFLPILAGDDAAAVHAGQRPAGTGRRRSPARTTR